METEQKLEQAIMDCGEKRREGELKIQELKADLRKMRDKRVQSVQAVN